MKAELKMDFDYTTSNHKSFRKRHYYQTMITLTNKKNEQCIISLNSLLDKRIVLGIVKELNNKNDFSVTKKSVKKLSSDIDDIDDNEIIYIENSQIYIIFNNITLILPVGCNIMDTLLINNIVNIV